jgi:hypothetical protein
MGSKNEHLVCRLVLSEQTIGETDVEKVVDTTQRQVARVAGVLYLVIIIAGIWAFFFVRSSLIVPGDAAATANKVIASEGLFRASIAADLIMIMSDVALALAFYVLLKPVNRSLSLLAAFFRLAQAANLGINVLNLFFGLQLLHGAGNVVAFSAEQLNALALIFFNAHGVGYTISLVFFGFGILVLGYLIFKSGYLPQILGILLIIAALGYLVDGFANVLLINYADYADLLGTIVFGPALIAELAVALWLTIKGVKIQPAQ